MFYVQKNKCDQCLFSKNRIVDKKRADAIIKNTLKKDSYFVCHKKQTTEFKGEYLCCRGFWDKYKLVSKMTRMAEMFGLVKEVQVGDKDESK